MHDDSRTVDDKWDAGDMGCGELLIHLAGRMRALAPGQIFELRAQDPGAVEDIPSWCRLTGHTLECAQHPVYRIRRRKN
jgi:tRNA 2-thiouridine synthesizing protein A